MNKLFYLIFFVIASTEICNAKNNTISAQLGGLPRQLQVTTLYGDKESKFMLVFKKNNSQISFKSSYGEKAKNKIKDKDALFILDRFAKLSNTKKIPNECYRAKVEIKSISVQNQEQTKASCFGISNQNSNEYVSFVNTLVMAL